jgi:hypothetical protein
LSLTKRLMEEWQHKVAVGKGIAIDAGVLAVCEIHEIVYDGGVEIERAYMLGNARFTAGKLNEVFADRRDLTDAIKKAYEENCGDGCWICQKNAAS